MQMMSEMGHLLAANLLNEAIVGDRLAVRLDDSSTAGVIVGSTAEVPLIRKSPLPMVSSFPLELVLDLVHSVLSVLSVLLILHLLVHLKSLFPLQRLFSSLTWWISSSVYSWLE